MQSAAALATLAAAAAGFAPVGGHAMYYDCEGKGSPTVVLDAGSPETSAAWRWVQPAVARVTRVCSYDRAGLGRSAPAPPGKRSALDQARELHELLARAGVRGPYVIVGHSWGGLIAQLFAHVYPRQVRGAVLLDPTNFAYGTPPRARTAEGIDVLLSMRELSSVKTLGAIPLVVLGSKTSLRDKVFQRAQLEEAALSRQGIYAIAATSTHELPYPAPKGRPDLVIEAVLAVVHAVRNHTRLPSCRAVLGTGVVCRR